MRVAMISEPSMMGSDFMAQDDLRQKTLGVKDRECVVEKGEGAPGGSTFLGNEFVREAFPL